VPEAAAYWGVSRSTVFRAIKLGRLPAYFVYQREYWIPGDCVDGQPFPSDTRVELPPHPSSVLSGMFQPAVDPVTPAWQAWLAGAATPWAPAQTGLRRSS
jgi:excisionase family DNA binding protein